MQQLPRIWAPRTRASLQFYSEVIVGFIVLVPVRALSLSFYTLTTWIWNYVIHFQWAQVRILQSPMGPNWATQAQIDYQRRLLKSSTKQVPKKKKKKVVERVVRTPRGGEESNEQLHHFFLFLFSDKKKKDKEN